MTFSRVLLFTSMILCTAILSVFADSQAGQPPNIIIIFIDDMGYADIGPFGSELNRTPNLDRMAGEGLRLTSFYAAPVCTPSRAALMTGCYPPRVGLGMGSWHGVLMPGDNHGLNPAETTIAEVLKTRGYATACVGKWHLGDQPDFLPTRQGFDYYYGLPYSNDMNPSNDAKGRNFPPLPLMRNEEPQKAVDDQSFLTEAYTQEAVKFIREHKSEPFFLYMPHTMVHFPLAAGPDFEGKSANGILGDAIEEIDWSVGRIMDTLRELNLDRRTLVLFTSDNGPARRAAGPLRGQKGSTYEGGMREPTVAWWPGRIPAGSECDAVSGVIDLLPTAAALSGAKLPANQIDGKDISSLLFDPARAKSPHESYFYYKGNSLCAVRSGPWKLHVFSGRKATKELYHLDRDIGEKINIAAEHPEVVEKLMGYIEAARRDLGDGEKWPGENCRPVGTVENPKFLIARPGKTGSAAHEPVGRGTLRKVVAPSARESGKMPNVVLIYADDLGYGDLGCYGATHVKTPNIDRLAKEGRRFTDAHSSSAVCSPSRYGLLTGRYPLRRNFWGPIPTDQPLTIDPRRLTLGKLMKDAGYATACIGKWHLGFGDKKPTDYNSDLKPGPLELGFDYYFGVPLVNSGPPFVYVENHRVVGLDPSDPFVYGKKSVTKKYPEKSGYSRIGGADAAHRLYIDDQVGTTLKEKSVAWLKQQKGDQPFFMYLATTNIHHPFTPAPRFVGTSDCGLYGDFIHELDWIVGEVLAALDEMKVADNTLVIFTSDNGGMFNVTGQKGWSAGHRMNGELLGFKFGAWEGGHRVPFIARWPGKIPAGTTSDQLISQVDLLATLAGIVDRPLKAGEGQDSINQLASLTGTPTAPVRDTMIISPHQMSHLTLRKGKWVYIPAQDSGGFQGTKPGSHGFGGAATLAFTGRSNSDVVEGKVRSDASPAQLYNLEEDPSQTTNLYSAKPELVKELEAELQGYRKSIPPGAPLGWSPRPKTRSAGTKRKTADGPYPSDFTYSTAIGPEKGVTRRDPSDVLKVGGTYYVWYSKVLKAPGVFKYPSGYSADIYYATSQDGKEWNEQGLAVGKGGSGAFDEHGVFTPNILAADSRYYLFYTGVPKPFDADTKTAIGLAVSDSPEGPWTKIETNPVLLPSEDPDDFDSMRVDDAAFVVRDQKYWFYYKGRKMGGSPGETKMGVAVADKPEGPYVKHAAGPLHKGHEVMVWPQGNGIVSMATAAGPRMIYYAEDGIEFSSRTAVTNAPRAPGCFREDAFGDGIGIQKLAWGISHATEQGDLYLRRFDSQFEIGKNLARTQNQPEPVAHDNAKPVGN